MATQTRSKVPDIGNIMDKIRQEKTTEPEATKAKPKKIVSPAKILKKKAVVEEVPRGIAKSGRMWKTPKEKFSTVKKSIYRRSFHKKMELRKELKHIKDLSNSIKEDRKRENIEKKERREENSKRRLENERKSEIVQIIKNPAKIKRMKKKALRSIEKRDLSKVKAI